ncbi:hypothetical protein PCANC_05335 [Puccinia coronata f. sp. avenae]|uniref:Uncharacterized protein n=1 Tax=Puccinia coronata f. sp. avenae TaxID=200324 RepID=A0A2N5VXD2_9BASI|nr:hypothetical protein PCASD_09373 [Puccinia coronata f. sp. avenae]PLW54640.1 hypothetical protein PCANC_05335 [Puccinia coronata f. sp. avenae]
MEAVGEGYVSILAPDNTPVELEALHVPSLRKPLVSLSRLVAEGCAMQTISRSSFDVIRDHKVIISGNVQKGVCTAKLWFLEPQDDAVSLRL